MTQVASGCGSPSDPTTGSDGPPNSVGIARRPDCSIIVRHTLVAIRYSHERTDERPSNRSHAFQARTMASCTASSASKDEPSIR